MRRLFLLLFVFTSGVVFAADNPAAAPVKKPVIKIGVILPLSGNSDHLGQPLRELIQYKVAHFPKDSRFEYKLLFEDDQLEQRQSLLAAQRLVGWDHVDVLMTFFSGPGVVLAPYATQRKVPHLMWSFNLKGPDGVFNFDHVTPMNQAAETWTKHAEELGYKKIALLVMRNAGGEAVLKAMEDYKQKSKLEWTSVTRYNPDERDFRMILAKIRETNPELLYIYGVDPAIEIILRQKREIGWKEIPISAIGCFDLVYGNPLADGCWYVSSDMPTLEHMQWYRQTFKHDYVPCGAGVYDDYMELLYRACENYKGQGKPTGEDIAAYLRNVKDFDGACGKISCNAKGVFETKPTLLMIKNGTVTPISQPSQP